MYEINLTSKDYDMPYKDNIFYIKRDIPKLHIEASNGVKTFWNYIKLCLESQSFASIVFKDSKFFEVTGIGGFYTADKHVARLALNENILNKDSDTIKFHDNESIAIFIHECSHFVHLIENEGLCQQTCKYTGKKIGIETTDGRYFTEREAWYLSLRFNHLFKLNMEDDINSINRRNLINVGLTYHYIKGEAPWFDENADDNKQIDYEFFKNNNIDDFDLINGHFKLINDVKNEEK